MSGVLLMSLVTPHMVTLSQVATLGTPEVITAQSSASDCLLLLLPTLTLYTAAVHSLYTLTYHLYK